MKKRIIILSLIIALIIPTAGCFEKTTVESLLEDAVAKLEKVESYEMNGKLDLDIQIESADFEMSIVGEAEASGEITDKEAHVQGDYTFSSMDEKQTGDFEMYLIEDKDEITAYTNTDGDWIKSSVDEDEDDFEEAQKMLEAVKLHKLVALLSDYSDDLTLAKKTEKVGKADAYVLEGKVSGEYFTDFLKSLDVEEIKEDIDDMLAENDIDLEDYTVDIKLLIDKKSKLPVLLEMDLADAVTKAVEEYMNQLMGSLEGLDDYDYEEDDEEDAESTPTPTAAPEPEITVKTCSLEIEFSSFDDVKSIKVPEDVEDEAITSEEQEEAIEGALEGILD